MLNKNYWNLINKNLRPRVEVLWIRKKAIRKIIYSQTYLLLTWLTLFISTKDNNILTIVFEY